MRYLSIVLLLVVSSVARAGDPAAQQPASGAQNAMKFETFVLNDDPQYIGGEVCHCVIPAGWKTEGGMVWDLSTAFPAQVHLRVFDPNSAASFGTYPAMYFYWKPNDRMARPGGKYGGETIEPPVADQFEAAARVFIPAYRPDLARAKIVETEKLPKMSELIYKSLQPTMGPQYQMKVASGRIRYEYAVNGQPVQEDLFIVYRQVAHMRLGYMNWGLEHMTSVRGPKGDLEKLREMHDVMMRSSTPNLHWYNIYNQYEVAKFDRERIASIQAGERAREQAKQSDIVNQGIKDRYESYQKSQDELSESRAETMRGETPWQGPDGSRVLLPAEYGHAWRDDNGQYIVTNDIGYNPNSDLNLHSTWTPMDQAK